MNGRVGESAGGEVGMVFLYRNLVRVHATVMSELSLRFGQRIDEKTFTKILQGNLAVRVAEQALGEFQEKSKRWVKRTQPVGNDATSNRGNFAADKSLPLEPWFTL